ncbi:NfeD family protein [Stieleria sp. JC731]|uniref:DUF5685 family protein n=1 Tax=Pirellulaceae TaxID=2691357 RepID=UPI001E3AABE7|nr:NfeD family protein [Stieleria sp. JC731]MCC9603410.1 NfeD family protein [Stieleria sp. JC731]
MISTIDLGCLGDETLFGFLRGNQCDRRYRQVYATVCSSLRHRHGFRLLPFVSYEAVWLHCLAVDLQLIPAPASDMVTCCKTQRRHSPLAKTPVPCASQAVPGLEPTAMLEFDLAFTVLLVQTKLDDDVRDRNSIIAKLLRRLYRSAWNQTKDFFAALDPEFNDKLQGLFSDHLKLERQERPIQLEQYCGPTGAAFAEVFELGAKAIAASTDLANSESIQQQFRQAGEQIGRALIAFDCAMDFDADQRRGDFNPLADGNAIFDALNYSQQQLCQLGFQIDQWVAERCIAGRSLAGFRVAEGCEVANPMTTTVLKQLIRKIGRHKQTRVKKEFSSSYKQARADRHWISLSPKRLQHGFCDCDCCCDVGGCDSCCGAGDAGCVSEGCGSDGCGILVCSCPCDAFCTDCQNDDTKRKAKGGESDDSEADMPLINMGTEAIARTKLSPYGTIGLGETFAGMDRASDCSSADGQEYPAKSDRGVIEPGSRVRVIGRKPFGFLVREVE